MMTQTKSVTMSAGLALMLMTGTTAGREMPQWQPHLFLTASGDVWSPGGVDKDRFLASLGGTLSLVYWLDWNTQLKLSGSYAPLNTERYYWRPNPDSSFAPDIWDVKGSLRAVSLEFRRLFPTDNKNFLYLALGADYYDFGPVKGKYQIYGPGAVTSGEIIEERNPSKAFGGHFAPGLFFLFYPQVSVDVTVKIHFMYDGQNAVHWIEPTFTLGYRIF